MNVQPAIFAVAVALFLCLLLGAALLALWRARKMTSAESSLQPLLDRLLVVDRSRIAAVALDEGDAAQGDLEGWQIWEMIGGMDGLEALSKNCEVLIQLAFHVQQFYLEALPVAEQLRLNAREFQWHLDRLRGAEGRGNLSTAFPDYAQRAVAIYYGMTRHVLALYSASQSPGFAQLQAVL